MAEECAHRFIQALIKPDGNSAVAVCYMCKQIMPGWRVEFAEIAPGVYSTKFVQIH